MKQNINIEAEGSELILKNKAGDYVIIPKKYRTKVQDMIKEGCHSCIDSLVETLPVMEDYAQDGTLFPNNETVKVNQNNEVKEYNTSSQEYRDLYNSGRLMNYDKNTDTYIAAKPLEEVTVTAEAPQWLKYKREYEKNNPKKDYINKYLTPFARSLGNTETNYPKRLDEEYEQKSLDYIGEQLVKNKPQGKLSRAEWLNQMSDKEEEIIKRNPKYQSSLWADTKRGLTSLVEQNPLQTFQNIINSSDYTNREKQEMLKDYIDHPVMSKLGDAAKILNPLTLPSKMVQSAYKDNYSFTDALKGKKNNAGIVEDIVTDPLNLVGVGLFGKLSKADKVIDATKAGSKVLSKKEGLNKIDNILQESNQLPEPPHEIILDQPSNYIETINLERQGVKNKKIMPSFDDVDLGNDLILRNNPSRVVNKEDILGKHRALVSVKNKKTNEYIDLKSWKDIDGKIYYYMSASMPSSKIKAGRAYMELEKHIPKGESLLENTSLSYDSFLNILKQTKNPKFETFVKGRIPMNDMAVSNKLKSIGNRTSDSIDLGFYNKELADNAVNELNILIDKYNLPKATVIKRTVSTQPAAHLPYEKKDIFEIELPNIGLKKLYSIIGLTSAGAAIQSQNQNKSEQ